VIAAASIPGRTTASAAWLRALEKTSTIPRHPERILPTVIEEMSGQSSPALLSDRECLSYEALAALSNQYARWFLAQGLAKGDVVCLLMTNRPEYFAVWLGVTSVGGVVALLNTNLSGASLAHCINVVAAKHLIVEDVLAGSLATALPHLAVLPKLWAHGANAASLPRVDTDVRQQRDGKLQGAERRRVSIEDRALCIFTSGTTGLPKAANVSHARIMQWSNWFAGMMGIEPADRMYGCLPMYHSVGGVLTPGAVLAGGGSMVIREKFSASQFWEDVCRWDCTLFQYIGELCRYLLHAAPATRQFDHRIRMACGNGLAPEIWDDFKERFRVPQIFEFYAATEGGVSLFNIEGRRGAIGHIPGYLAHRFSPALLQIDLETGQPQRDERGFCVQCAANQPGEAIGKMVQETSGIGSRFEGYTDPQATSAKILRDVFEPGDSWIRTGDLMRKDASGFYYFVDRLGDTFRWKGENVATLEVAEAICAFPGIEHTAVYGVTIPGADGRVGMAAIVTSAAMDLTGLRKHLTSRLPAYARPAFLRFRNDIEITGTLKYSKADLQRQGYDPGTVSDTIYFDDPQSQAFVPLGRELYESIQAGDIRL